MCWEHFITLNQDRKITERKSKKDRRQRDGRIRKNMIPHIKMVLNSYQELLNKSYSLMDEEQIDRIENILSFRRETLHDYTLEALDEKG